MSEQKKDLTNSTVHRHNILNNPFVFQEIEKATHIQGISESDYADGGKPQSVSLVNVCHILRHRCREMRKP